MHAVLTIIAIGNDKETAIAYNITITIYSYIARSETWPMKLMCITILWVVKQVNDLTGISTMLYKSRCVMSVTVN